MTHRGQRAEPPDPAPDPEPDLPATYVEITVGDRQVVVGAAEPLAVVTAAALAVWRELGPAGPPSPAVMEPGPVGFGIGQLAAVDLAEGGRLLPPEITLPDRLIPEQETPDDRRNN